MVQGLQLRKGPLSPSLPLPCVQIPNPKLFSTKGLPAQESILITQRSPKPSGIMEKGPARPVLQCLSHCCYLEGHAFRSTALSPII